MKDLPGKCKVWILVLWGRILRIAGICRENVLRFFGVNSAQGGDDASQPEQPGEPSQQADAQPGSDAAAPDSVRGEPPADSPEQDHPPAQPESGSAWTRVAAYLRGALHRALEFCKQNRTVPVSVAVLVVLLGISMAMSQPGSREVSAPVVEKALSFEQPTADSGSSVLLNGKESMTVKQVEQGVTIKPSAEFMVTAISKERFMIRLLNPKGVKYTIFYRDSKEEKPISVVLDKTPLSVTMTSQNQNTFSINGEIALCFSEKIDESTLRSSLSVWPEFPYTLEVEEERAWIRPSEPLNYEAEYTVLISGNMSSSSGRRKLAQDENLYLKTQRKSFKVALTSTSGSMIQYGFPYKMEFTASVRDSVETPMIVELYSFPSMGKYKTQSEALVNYSVDLAPLEREEVFAQRLENETNKIELPNLKVGGYVLRATVQDPGSEDQYEFRQAFAVSDFSIYGQTSGTETLIWANSSATGQPLTGYTVEFLKSPGADPLAAAVTDADGVALLNYVEPDDHDPYYDGYRRGPKRMICLRDQSGEIVYVDNTNILNRYGYWSRDDRYYSFFQTDRPLYKPTDEIQFWGFIKPYQYNVNPMPTTALVTIGEGGLNQSLEVTIGPNGSFQGKFDLEAARSNNYMISLKILDPYQPQPAETESQESSGSSEASSSSESSSEASGEGADEEEQLVEPVYIALENQYIQVKDYKKPTFVIESEVDKTLYLPDEEVKLTMRPTFYDGTPMPQYPLELKVRESYYDSYSYTEMITTDDEGVGTASFQAYMRDKNVVNSWLPTTNRYSVTISEDGENITHYGEYSYLAVDTMLIGELVKEDGGNVSLSVETAATNLDAFRSQEELENANLPYWNSYDYTRAQFERFRGAAKDVDVEVKLTYSYYAKDGKRKNEDRTLNLKTEDGKAEAKNLINVPFDSQRYLYVSVELRCADSKGRLVMANQYFYNGYEHFDEKSKQPAFSPGYNFKLTDQNGNDMLGNYYAYLSYNEASMNDGDTMNFELFYQDKPTTNRGKILYTIIQGEIIQRGITTSSTLQFRQTARNANSINVVATYFDGENVYPIRNTIVSLTKTSVTLNVEITPDKESYRPGEQATLSVKVTDRNGRGVAGTTCISVVDEAIYALREHSIDVLYDLYRDFYFDHYYVMKYSTGHGDFIHEYGSDSGKGAGPGMQFLDSLRKNFRDTALFELVRTDANGNGTITFTLPDNVTSWRVTGVSIGDNLYAGQSKSNIISTMPFFVSPVVSQKYIAGDDIAMLVQGHGIALDKDSQIHYTVNIKGDGVDETKEEDGKAYSSRQFNFGKLSEGEYTLTVTAQFSNYRDTVEIPLAIVSSNLELVINKTLDLSQPLDLKAMRYPVTLTFYDKEHEAYYSSVSSLLHHYCMQASQRMSRFVAKRALTQHMDPSAIPQYIRAGNDSAGDMQNYDGGIGYYPGDESDPFITLKVLIVAKDQFNLDTMSEYFQKLIDKNKSPEEVAAGHLGLAVIGKPIKGDLLVQLEKARDVVPRIYYIAALAYIGETETAQAQYKMHVTPHMTGSPAGGSYYNAGVTVTDKDQVTNERATAAAWIAAAVLGHEDADAISLYFAQNRWRISTLFECMIYVTHYNKEVMPSAFSYSANGRTVNVDLGVGGRHTVSFSKSEFESLRMVDVPENITANAYFIGEPSEVDIQPSEELTITRTITPVENNRYRIDLTIDFTDDAPTGYYDISEWVPSNMRLYSVDKANRNKGEYWWYSHTTEGQKIYFKVSRHTDTRQIRLQYTAQKTYDAEAVVDSAYIIHGDTGINAVTERTTIK